MKRLIAVAGAMVLASAFAGTASAEKVDMKAFSCQELTQSMASTDKDDQYGASVILYWLHGYLRTEAQGTVVDFDNMMKSFEKTTEFCAKNPNIGVMTASQKFMGESEPKAGKGAIDLAIIKCEKVVHTDKDDTQGLGQILMWLHGFHAATDGETVIDFDKFSSDSKSIGEYCNENQQVGFYTASEKVMSGEDAGDGEDTSGSEDDSQN